MTRILLTGATGYIGSHTWLVLHEAGHEVVGIDNFANSSPAVLERLRELMRCPPVFEQVDVTDPGALAAVLSRHRCDAAVHFAAHKAVGESVQRPLEYYRNNLGGLVSLAQALADAGVKRLVFSSSATVYGQPERLPIDEDAPLAATNPYGTTKLVGEQLLRELERCDPAWRISYLRYFNPVGAHPSGRIGEDPRGTPNNLMPYVTQVAVGKLEYLRVFGDDYDTPDGTAVRDYIHIEDLGEAHLLALAHLRRGGASQLLNLGNGTGYSVLEVIETARRVTGSDVPYEMGPRREGDPPRLVGDAALAREVLGWTPRRPSLEEIVRSAWEWMQAHPEGYGTH